MPLITVHLDRVFDIVHTMHNRKPVTNFGFESEGVKHYSVPGPGKLNIQAGVTLTVFLRKANNWQTLLGWYDHSSREVVIESGSYEWFFIVWSIPIVIFLTKTFASHPVVSLLLLFGLSLWVLHCAASIRTLTKAKNQLVALRQREHTS
ncbi:MAG TPA: hypothetical protein PKC80_11735 [Burkholderiaceae bacterium]|nr:hypothetical protein [Burkholderiaceae bacterium]